MRVMVTGAAPISPSVLKFLRAALGCQVINTLILCVCSLYSDFYDSGSLLILKCTIRWW